MRKRTWAGGWLLALVLGFGAGSPVQAVITREMPLRHMIDDSTFIFTVKVETLDGGNLRMMLLADQSLKGKWPFPKLPVLLKGDKEAAKGMQTPQLLKRLAKDLPLVLFVRKLDSEYIAFAYTNGTWFQLEGVQPEGADSVRWSFAHLEPYLRRGFKGTTAAMQQTVAGVLQGKQKPPPWDGKEKPGLGPEVMPEKKEGALRPMVGGPIFAVIPTVMVGGPLAVLAMLFPTLFGGWKRWLAFISVVCSTSTVYLLHWWFGGYLAQTVWDSPLLLWLTLTVVTFLGSVWAWLRYVRLVQLQQLETAPAARVPGRTELGILILLSLVGLGILGYGYLSGANLREVAWLQVLVIALGAWTATAYTVRLRLRGDRPFPAIPTEVVMLSAMVLASTVLAGTQQGRPVIPARQEEAGAKSQEARCRIAWKFAIPTRGSISSMPLVAGDRVYVAVAHEDTFRPFGAVYCLNAATGEQVWTTRGKVKMKMIAISSPGLADGRLYVGEGFHEDSDCQLHCLDAETGKLLWQFETTSHVESSPMVMGGRVYFGAGDDGVYCLDAATGKEVWHFPGLHVDATPLVHEGRVFVGSGVGDVVKEMAAVCIDAEKGSLIWKEPLDQPAWGSPVQAGDLVYFGLGQGRLNPSEPASEGALLAVHAADGKQRWVERTADAVLRGAVVDRDSVYFASRSGSVCAANARTGKVRWNREVKGKMFTSPALAVSSKTSETTGVYALSAEGEVVCLDARAGNVLWTYSLPDQLAAQVQVLSSPRVHGGRLFFGAMTVGASGRSPMVVCLEDPAAIAAQKDKVRALDATGLSRGGSRLFLETTVSLHGTSPWHPGLCLYESQ